jgi:hypothetical protein
MTHVTSQQFATLPVIADATLMDAKPGLQSGDILIHHRHSGKGWEDRPFHASTVAILTDNNEIRTKMYDSLPQDGVRRKEWPSFYDDCVVFRPYGAGGDDAGAEAGLQADAFYNARVGYSDGLFGIGRAIGCGIGSRKFGNSARARLAKYKARATPVPKNCVCSEYVVLCYQMALKEGDAHFFQLDAKYTTPGVLESFLMNSVNWHMVGAVRGFVKP